ncbi:hypothetical protein BH10ACI1_BH10ACI1_16310 [soil metagenome]
MRKFAVTWLILISFSMIVFGQSGRRVQPTPTPTPEKKQTDETSYSESKPVVKSSNRIVPNIRGGNPTQTQNTQTQNKTETNETLNDSEDEVIKVETNLITIPVSVFDRNGLYIPNLKQEDFKIFENGKEQEVAYFGTSEKPFTVVLLLDTSPSAEGVLQQIKQAAINFVDKLKPQDSVIVIEFAGDVHVLTEATNDRQQIYKAINRADIGNGTVLYDAVNFSIRKRLNKIQGRKAIVLLTDGVDTFSRSTYDKSIHEAEEADALIFPIYYNTSRDTLRQVDIFNSGTRREILDAYILGKQYLNDLADNTGGKFYQAETTSASLNDAFESIAEELRRQYSIGYYPTETGAVGQRKQIKVRVNRPNMIVRARDSYIVGGQQTTTTK